MIELEKSDICNLSKIPFANWDGNPCHVTAIQLLKNPNITLEETALYAWYKWIEKYKDSSLSDFYGLNIEPLREHKCTSIFFPWMHTKPVKRFSDFAFLFPVDEGQIKKQIEKLKKLLTSFRLNGYDPERFIDKRGGHATGYFLEFQEQKKFYVVSGNHRVSTFFALWPDKKMPAQYEKYEFMKSRDLANNGAVKDKILPTLFSDKQISEWPAVKSGYLSKEDAASILGRYFV